MRQLFAKYKKAFTAAAGVIASAILAALLGDGIVNINEWANVLILGLGAANVAIAPNTPGARYVKAMIMGTSAAATVFLSVFTGGLATAELAQIAIAFGTAAGVFKVKNEGDQYDRQLNERMF